jgi:hypothetical protein
MSQNKDLVSVINGMLNETLTEAEQNVHNKKAHDAITSKPQSHSDSPDTQGVVGGKDTGVLDAGGEKDVGEKGKGEFASDAADNSTEIGIGAADKPVLDSGADKDVGKQRDGKTAMPSGASAEVEADQGPHDQASDKFKVSESEEDEAVEAPQMPEESGDIAEKCSEEEVDEIAPVVARVAAGAAAKSVASKVQDEDYEQNKDNKKAMGEKCSEEDDLEEKLHGDQHKLDHDKDGDIDAGDMEKVRNHGAVKEAEGEELKKVSGEANREQRPDAEKGDNAPETKKETFGSEHAPHDQGSDPISTAQKVHKCCAEDEDLDDLEESQDTKHDKNANGIDDKDENKAKDTDVKKMKEKCNEDSLEEDFKEKAAIIFETTVNEKVLSIREEMETEFENRLTEAKAELNTTVDRLVTEATQEWLAENQLEIKYSLRTEIAENFIRGLKGLFAENYIEIPEEEVSVVDELTEAVESYKEQLGEQQAKLEEANAIILENTKQGAFEEISEGLTETQKIKLEKLSEAIVAEDIEEFEYKLTQLKESYFTGLAEQIVPMADEIIEEQAAPVDTSSPVNNYANFLSRTIR